MRNTFVITLLAVIALLFPSAPVFGHHGSASYDTTKVVTVKATVTSWLWENPHCLLKFDVTDESGKVVHWSAETADPTSLHDRGWSKDLLKPGDEVTVKMITLKNGQPIGRIQQVVLANGTVLKEGGGN